MRTSSVVFFVSLIMAALLRFCFEIPMYITVGIGLVAGIAVAFYQRGSSLQQAGKNVAGKLKQSKVTVAIAIAVVMAISTTVYFIANTPKASKEVRQQYKELDEVRKIRKIKKDQENDVEAQLVIAQATNWLLTHPNEKDIPPEMKESTEAAVKGKMVAQLKTEKTQLEKKAEVRKESEPASKHSSVMEVNPRFNNRFQKIRGEETWAGYCFADQKPGWIRVPVSSGKFEIFAFGNGDSVKARNGKTEVSVGSRNVLDGDSIEVNCDQAVDSVEIVVKRAG